MPTAQYRSEQKLSKTDYRNCANKHNLCCNGKCTCDYGTRSNYDNIQYQHYVMGKRFQIQTVKDIPGWK